MCHKLEQSGAKKYISFKKGPKWFYQMKMGNLWIQLLQAKSLEVITLILTTTKGWINQKKKINDLPWTHWRTEDAEETATPKSEETSLFKETQLRSAYLE